MNILNSSEYSTRDDMDKALTSATEGGKQAVLIVGQKRLLISDVETAREQLAGKLANQIAENPKILDEIISRVENETPRDW